MSHGVNTRRRREAARAQRTRRRAEAKTRQPAAAKATQRCHPMPPSLQPVTSTTGGAMTRLARLVTRRGEERCSLAPRALVQGRWPPREARPTCDAPSQLRVGSGCARRSERSAGLASKARAMSGAAPGGGGGGLPSGMTGILNWCARPALRCGLRARCSRDAALPRLRADDGGCVQVIGAQRRHSAGQGHLGGGQEVVLRGHGGAHGCPCAARCALRKQPYAVQRFAASCRGAGALARASRAPGTRTASLPA